MRESSYDARKGDALPSLVQESWTLGGYAWVTLRKEEHAVSSWYGTANGNRRVGGALGPWLTNDLREHHRGDVCEGPRGCSCLRACPEQ
jgi:hypothetical protein